MADTQRTRAQILALFADNVTGQISAQDLRDYVVTIMEEEFANAGDFWAEPQAKYTTTDKSARGFKMYSQYIGEAVTFMDILTLDSNTGYWVRADATNSTKNGFIGMAMNTYASDYSTGEILIQGLVYNSALSATFLSKLGKPIFLASVTSAGSYAITAADSEYIIGFVMPSDNHGDSDIGKWYFSPGRWGIVGA